MSHFVPSPDSIPTKKAKRRFHIPWVNGRYGASFFVGSKEVFLGVAVSDVVVEKIIKRRTLPIPPAKTRTYGFDPFSSAPSDEP